jgi:hypothetical protein
MWTGQSAAGAPVSQTEKVWWEYKRADTDSRDQLWVPYGPTASAR